MKSSRQNQTTVSKSKLHFTFRNTQIKILNIFSYKKQLAYIASLIPYDQMTMEDFRDAHPELALDPINKPTFWPHTPEEQPDYKGDQEVKHDH